jgi:hypothetical protein
MIRFDKRGSPIVYFNIEQPASAESRRELSFTLEDYRALTRTVSTVEELRVALFMYQKPKARRAASTE